MLTIILVIILVAVLVVLFIESQRIKYKNTKGKHIENFWFYPNCLETMWSGVRCFPPYGYSPFRGYADPSNPYTDYLY